MEEKSKDAIIQEAEEEAKRIKTAESAPEVAPVPEDPKPVTGNNVPKKGNKLVIILIILLLLVIGCVTFFVIKSMSGKKENKENVVENKEPTNTENKEYNSDYKITGNGLQEFDLQILKLENYEENKIYSPLSIKYALSMLKDGTAGDTKKQIEAVIGDYQPKKYDNNDNMSFANSMFIRESHAAIINDDYKTMLQNKYGADVITDSFENPDNINKWVSDNTFGLIDKLIDKIDDQIDFYLINALAIDMDWVNQIHCASSSERSVPCKNYWVTYQHEKLQGEDYEYSRGEMPYSTDSDYPSVSFNGKDNIKSANVIATFNRYDAVNEIGENKIREEVGSAYKEWLESEQGKDYLESESQYGDVNAARDVDKYLESYIKELNDNYGKEDSSTDFSLYVDDNVKVFAKDLKTYDGTTLQYIGIMPKTTKLSDYVKNINVNDINTLISNLKDMSINNFEEGYVTIIEGKIPLFKYDYEISLKEDLMKLGITDVFDLDKADLSGIIKDLPAKIFEVKHKATIEFSNDGIKAAAATEIGGGAGSIGSFNYLFEVPTKRIDITFDNPYLYLIRDKDTGEVWFVGTVYDPIQK